MESQETLAKDDKLNEQKKSATNSVNGRVIDIIFTIIIFLLIWLSVYFENNPDKAILELSELKEKIFISSRVALWIGLVVCLIGNMLPIPTPYILIVWLIAVHYAELGPGYILLTAFMASIGSLIGEITGYFIGRGANKVISEDMKKNIDFFSEILESNRRIAPFLIYLFGATPLNDDLIMVPLGMMEYPVKKTVFWCWLGKLTMTTLIAFIPDFFNVMAEGYSWFSTMLPLFLIVIIMYILIKVDWIELLHNNAKLNDFLVRFFKIKIDSEKNDQND